MGVGVPARTPGAIHTSQRADATARRLRRDLTFAEKQLWKALRAAEGFHFRRQAPMGPYVVDFICHRSRLIVEVDGGVHDIDAVAARDNERDAWLVSRGYQVIRFTNSQAIAATEATIEAILAAADARTPTPDPPRKGEGNGVRGRSQTTKAAFALPIVGRVGLWCSNGCWNREGPWRGASRAC